MMLNVMWMSNISLICREVVLKHRPMATRSIYSSQLQYLDRPGGNQISYRKTEGTKSPGVVFLPAYMASMNGGKTQALEAFCKQRGHSFVRFDYQGCGKSRGDLAVGKGTFDIWKTDAQAVLNQLTTGPQVLVGFSMGAAIMILLALENPSRVHALLGDATAVDFNKPVIHTEKLQKIGSGNATSQKRTYVTPLDFLNKQYQSCLLGASVKVTQPVCLIHGMQDDTIPYSSSVNLASRLQSGNVDLILRKSGKHRMSKPEDLRLLIQCLEKLLSIKY